MFNDDPINHPKHYTYGDIECVDVIEDWDLNWHLGNAVKYICRAGKKDKEFEIQDLKKAVWYLERYIKKEEVKAARMFKERFQLTHYGCKQDKGCCVDGATIICPPSGEDDEC